ncbi:MAG: lipopolysaccharide heptosyltransferase II [Pirellula sp.]|jgi:heptosyltransferase-2|nr:lipopolysaccharide heptosyltransferase II [Pirellula sp.]
MKLAIMLPNWIGDACMATPALRALRTGNSGLEHVCWIGRPAPMMVLEGLPWCDSTLVYKPRARGAGIFNRRGLAREMKRRRFDAVLLLTNSLSTAAIAWLSGVPRRIGYARDGRSMMLTERVPVIDGQRNARTDPCIDSYLRLADHLGCDISDRRMELTATQHDRQMTEDLWKKIGFRNNCLTIVMNTGAATADTKRWPNHHAVSVAKRLSKDYGAQVLIHCGPAEREVADAIQHDADDPKIRSMGCMTSLPLGLSKGVLERSDLVISTDSGPRHMAVALNKPVISLFGPISPSLTRTYNVPEATLSLGLECQPCGKYKCPLKHAKCMKDLDSRRVLAAATKILQESPTLQRRAS